MQTMVQSHAIIDDVPYSLAQGQDLEQLKRAVEESVRAGGAFVEFTIVGHREVSALISPSTRVVFTVETVQFDERDTGDLGLPFGGKYDYGMEF